MKSLVALAFLVASAAGAQEVLIDINETRSNADDQFCWAPVQSTARLASPATQDVTIVLTSTGADPQSLARVVFQPGPRPSRVNFAPTDSLTLTLPKSGQPVKFSVAGKWTANHEASRRLGDVIIEARRAGVVIASIPVMIRVRKDVQTLTVEERDRLLTAMGQLYSQHWFDRYAYIHDNVGAVAHSFSAFRSVFLAWHRAFMLDLERRLQAIDPSVALPYWRFDAGADKLFSTSFLGVVDASSAAVRFDATNPLTAPNTTMTVDLSQVGASIGPLTRTNTESWKDQGPVAPRAFTFPDYRSATSVIEVSYHGDAHGAVGGRLGNPRTAAVDPLFYLLHANVDRAWALWQSHTAGALDPIRTVSIYPSGVFDPQCCALQQPRTAFADEPLWPWNVTTVSPVPAWAADPQQPAAFAFPIATGLGPSREPLVREMVDYMDSIGDGGALGYCYDEIPF